MDIKKLKPEAEITVDLETTSDPISITFRMSFLKFDAVQDYVTEAMETGKKPRLSEVVRRNVSEAVVGWDLEENGKPLPCTEENKAKWLPLFFGFIVKHEKEEPEPGVKDPTKWMLVRVLAEFAGDSRNFLKN